MARLDVKEFVPDSYDFKLLSVKLKYASGTGAPKGYLFEKNTYNIWNLSGQTMELNQNDFYNTYNFPKDVDAYPEYLGEATSTTQNNKTVKGIWYKKVLYMYEYPEKIGSVETSTPELEVKYVTNGQENTVSVTMVQRSETTSIRFPIERNYVYTLVIGDTETEAGPLTFRLVVTDWTLHEMDADLNQGK